MTILQYYSHTDDGPISHPNKSSPRVLPDRGKQSVWPSWAGEGGELIQLQGNQEGQQLCAGAAPDKPVGAEHRAI